MGLLCGWGRRYGARGAAIGLQWGWGGRYGAPMGLGGPLWGQGGCYGAAMGPGVPLWGQGGRYGAAVGLTLLAQQHIDVGRNAEGAVGDVFQQRRFPLPAIKPTPPQKRLINTPPLRPTFVTGVG